MPRKHYRKEKKHYAAKVLVAAAIVAAVAVSSVITVMANTVPCTVVDGDRSYSFSLLSPDMNSILSKAEEEGMPPLTELDKTAPEEGRVKIIRALNVIVNENGTFTETYAYEGDTVAAALENAGITIGKNDTVAPAAETVITADTDVSIERNITVVVTADFKTRKTVVHGGTVAEAIASLGITLDEADKLTPSADTEVTDGMAVTVTRAKDITITDAGEAKNYTVYASNVRLALRETGYKLGEEDKLNAALSQKISDGTEIEISRVSFEEVKETEAVEYGTRYVDTDELDKGDTQVQTEGVEGEKEVTYRDLYINGEFSERIVKSEKITKEPTEEVVLRGTKETASSSGSSNQEDYSQAPSQGEATGNTFVDASGNVVSYSNVLTGSCTAYTGGTQTSIGMTPAYGVVAVNPNIIPYGTRLYITSDGYTYGYAVAGDTGGALMCGDALVDVYYDTLEECYNFGRRNMTVYILS